MERRYSHGIWESLVASFDDDECANDDEFVFDEEINVEGSEEFVGASIVTLTAEADASLESIGASTNTMGAPRDLGMTFTGAEEALTNPRASITVSLRSWIKRALHSIGNVNGRSAATSQNYLNAALKIAKSLSDQIVQAEELIHRYETSTKLDWLPTNNEDWAEYIMVQLYDDSNTCARLDYHDELLSLPENENLESLLKSFEREIPADGEAVTNNNYATNTHVANEEAKPLTVQLDYYEKNNNCTGLEYHDELLSLPENEKLESFLKSFEKEIPDDRETIENYAMDQHDAKVEAKPIYQPGANQEDLSFSSPREDVNYLNIAAAKFQCPEGKRISKENDPVKESSRRIYFLGLVFYELFTGGEVPPEHLRAIAMCTNAFVSLSTLTLVDKLDEHQISSNDNNKRHQGSSSSDGHTGLCKLSCEYLRFTGISSPICSMIFNMLDSVYGDLSGIESYKNMIQVASDLQLMIDKPSKFLQGLDMEKLSVSGLPIAEVEIPRGEELEAIKSCYNRCIAGSCEIAMVSGKSGTGKSWLVHRLANFVESQGGLVLRGKFDQMQQSKPFSGKELSSCLLFTIRTIGIKRILILLLIAALTSAFDQYCDLLLREKNAKLVKQTVGSLKANLVHDTDLLFKVIPKLKLIMGKTIKFSECIADEDLGQIDGNALLRLQYLISQFVDIISTHSAVSLVLWLDDLQWADEASLTILYRILINSHSRKFFFIGCRRDDEMRNNHAFWKMMGNDKADVGVHVTQVKMNCMTKNSINVAVSDLLCLFPRLVQSLSDIVYSRTKGNILFFIQLILTLYRDNLLYLDLNLHRWKWDEDKIVIAKLPDNIAICLTDSISKLPIEVQMALNTLSLLGASAKLSYMKIFDSHLRMKRKIFEPLKEAAAEGLVTISNGSFHFCHDRIQEASLSLIGEMDRCHHHLAYGKCLVKKATETNDDDMMFTAVDQINLSGPAAITDHRDYLNMAYHNLVAGKLAMNMAEFASASSFFRHGISFLRDGHWQDHYNFSLEIYVLACKSGVSSGMDLQQLNTLSEQVLKNARSFEDTLETQLINIGVLANVRPSEALELGLSIVSRLGEEIPKPSKETLDPRRVLDVIEIQGVPEEYFLHYKMMTDSKMLMVMRYLSRIQVIAYHTKPLINPLVILKMLQITVSYGLSPAAPPAFTNFGSYLAKLGDLSAGYKYALLGKALLDKLGANESRGEVSFMLSEIQMYCQPAQASNQMRIQSESSLLSHGDIYFACIIRLQHCNDAVWVGTNLSLVSELFYKARVFFEQQDHKIGLAFNLITHHVVLTISGKDNEAMALESMLVNIRDNPVPHLKRSL
eukprot:scaffold76682_cov82-Cyclotella_meneghiniana.AAC.8